MPLSIKDDGIAELAARLAKLRGISKQRAVKLVVQAELDRADEAVSIRDCLAACRAAYPLPAGTGAMAD